MGATTIEWTNATWNPLRGCTKISPGCKNCYAETFAERFRGVAGHPYEHGFDLRLVPEKLHEPLHWRIPRRVFVNSMSDLFQDGVPFEFVDRVFAVMAAAPQHTFQVLTKRPQRMREYCEGLTTAKGGLRFAAAVAREFAGEHTVLTQGIVDSMARDGASCLPFPNICLGVSVENEDQLQRIDTLKDTPAAVRFISFEPLLEDVGALILDGIDWVIVGGESGNVARTCDVEWIRSVVKECFLASIPVFVKQLGAAAFSLRDRLVGYGQPFPIGTKPESGWVRLKDCKGGDMSEWPDDLRRRDFPA